METRAPYRNRSTTGEQIGCVRTATATPRWAATICASTRRDDRDPSGMDELRALSRRSLWSLRLFLLISSAAFFARDFDLFAALPESILQILGCPPSPLLAHLALAGYVFTVLTPLVIHLLTGEQPMAQWRHLGYRAAFYGFYLFSNTLSANFLLVFAVGITLYLLEQGSICLALARTGQGDGQTI